MKKVFIILIIIIILGVGGYYAYNFLNNVGKKGGIPILPIEPEQANISEYYIYGTTTNIKGNLNISNLDYKSIKLVLYNGEFIEKDINVIEENGLTFYISEEINNGIYLDDINLGEYYMFIRLTYDNSEDVENDLVRYYVLNNQTDYQETIYYTVSNYNKKIIINSLNDYKTMMLSVKENQDNNIYDIVIDPGHGGMDGGASANGYSERDFTLEIANNLKTSLEVIGLKVKLTREEGQLTGNDLLNSYGTNGRAVIPGEVHAKYVFSIHLNSNPTTYVSGLEIYTPNNIDYTFAKLLEEKLTTYTGLNYSPNKTDKVYNGIYTRTFTESEIESSIKEANGKGITPYNVTTNCNYYYMIREVGGYITGAYVDGSDPEKGTNPYYESNVGSESYILELGYITNINDVNNLVNNENKYIEAIVDSVKDELKIN